MAGRPDPAFLNNVPTALPTIITTSPVSTASVTSTTGTSTTPVPTSSSTTLNVSASFTSTTGGIIAIPSGNSTPSILPVSVYAYVPSTALAIVLVLLYSTLIPYHFYLSVYNPHIRKSVAQKHSYTIPLLVACLLSTVGFSIRVISVAPSYRASIALYVLSQTFIIVAPIFVCATLYLLISHLMELCLPQGKDRIFLGISPYWLGRVFIVSDVLSFVFQGAGSVIMASGGWQGPRRSTGTSMLIVGLAAQLATFTLYVIVFAMFCYRVRGGYENRQKEKPSHEKHDGGASRDFGFNPLVKQVVKGVWIASVLVEIRSIFRTVQYSTGIDGYLFNHEWALWVFDAIPIWIALLVLGIFHPTRWLQSKRRSWFVEKNMRKAAPLPS